MADNLGTFIPVILVVLLFVGIGIYSLKKKTPMHFWAGTIVKPEEIRDIKAYNRANGIMWIIYGLSYLLIIPLEILFGDFWDIIISILAIPGLIVLVLCYNHIYKKYKSDDPIKKDSPNKKYEKCQKIVFCFMILIGLVPCLILATVDVSGGHELTIKDNTVKIQATSFKTENIKTIELLDEINIKGKVTGTNTITYSRGTFNVDGEKNIVYIYNDSSPYIKFNLKDNKTIYYNEKNSEDTEKTYNELIGFVE